MDDSKKEKMFPAFKVTAEMHETVSRLAQRNHRKLMDEIRHLIELGAQVEERYTSLYDLAVRQEAKKKRA